MVLVLRDDEGAEKSAVEKQGAGGLAGMGRDECAFSFLAFPIQVSIPLPAELHGKVQ